MLHNEKDDEEMCQVSGDILGILERSDLNWYEGIGALELTKKVMLDRVEYNTRE